MGEAKNAAEGHKLIKPRPFSGLGAKGLGLRRGVLKSTNVGTGFELLGVRV